MPEPYIGGDYVPTLLHSGEHDHFYQFHHVDDGGTAHARCLSCHMGTLYDPETHECADGKVRRITEHMRNETNGTLT